MHYTEIEPRALLGQMVEGGETFGKNCTTSRGGKTVINLVKQEPKYIYTAQVVPLG